MSVIEEAIYKKITDDATVSAVIGTRVRPELAADADEYPMLVYEKEDDEPRVAMGGKIGLTHARLSLQAWARTYSGAKDLRTKLKTLLHPVAQTILGVNIRLATISESSDLLEASVGRDRMRVYGCGLTIDVWYFE